MATMQKDEKGGEKQKLAVLQGRQDSFRENKKDKISSNVRQSTVKTQNAGCGASSGSLLTGPDRAPGLCQVLIFTDGKPEARHPPIDRNHPTPHSINFPAEGKSASQSKPEAAKSGPL